MACPLAAERVWTEKAQYHDAEKKYYESLSKVTIIFSLHRNINPLFNIIIIHKIYCAITNRCQIISMSGYAKRRTDTAKHFCSRNPRLSFTRINGD